MDNLEICPCCGSNACTKTVTENELTLHLCWTCGMNTNSLMKDGSEFEKQNFESTAELIKDLKQVHDGFAWYPKVLNIQEKGMVFPEWNKRAKDWYWASVKAVPVTEEEKEKYPDPHNQGDFYKFKMDIKNIKHYDKMCFMDAAEEIGIFEIQ